MIAILLTSIQITTVSSQMLVINEVLTANEICGIEGGNESIEKCRKLSKTGKLSKSQKSAKSKKKLSKSGNSPYVGTKKNGPSFLILDTKISSNYLLLAFIKAPILWYFYPEYYIQIKT